ncbi:MAG: hypothetical protein IIU39_00610 [Ruminococcus sp.]|nr:hypothetical protein [Ruminococcus sp.]
MNDKQMKELFDKLNPESGKKEKLREKILTAKPKRKNRRLILVAAVIAASIIASCVGINAINGGKIFSPSSYSGNEVLGQAANIADIDPIYAPDINYIDDERIVFTTQRGIVFYDRKSRKPYKTVDLQQIDCAYIEFGNEWEEPDVKTHVLADGESLFVFNTQKGLLFENFLFGRKPSSAAYEYTLKTKSAVPKTITDSERIKALYQKWSGRESGYTDTFDKYYAWLIKRDYNGGEGMYSYRTIKWKSKSAEFFSFLTVDDTEYRLRSFKKGSKKPETEELFIIGEKEKKEYRKAARLPEFFYTGGDKALAAIIAYEQKEYRPYLEKTEVWIPAYNVCGKFEEKNELLVFGHFWYFTYKRNGDTLVEYSGGENSRCYHLVKSGSAYKVKSVDIPREGSCLYEDLLKMTEKYPSVRDQMLSSPEPDQREFLQMYVKEYKLDIDYYYGSDKYLPIF